jgi:hypothetical protein
LTTSKDEKMNKKLFSEGAYFFIWGKNSEELLNCKFAAFYNAVPLTCVTCENCG